MLYSKQLLSSRTHTPSDYQIIKEQLIAKVFEIEHGEIQRDLPELLVVGKVTHVIKHPNADTLFVCQVNC
jgi:predicted RNA-binding protein with EMAP domain